VQQREELFGGQGKKCAICGSKEPKNKNGFVVDHCHETNKVRGILCHPCNTTLGNVNDDIKVLRRMIKYLRQHQ
jgi:hypothetical protein